MNNLYDNSLRLAAFRCILGQLHDASLITDAEFRNISKAIDHEGDALLFGNLPKHAHSRAASLAESP